MRDLKDVRSDIDAIDDQMTELFGKRMALAEEVAKIKAENDLPVTDPERERKIIFRLSKKLPEELSMYLKEFYETVFFTGKAYQSFVMNKTSATAETLKSVIKNGFKKMPDAATVACQGINGANSGAAAHTVARDPVEHFRVARGKILLFQDGGKRAEHDRVGAFQIAVFFRDVRTVQRKRLLPGLHHRRFLDRRAVIQQDAVVSEFVEIFFHRRTVEHDQQIDAAVHDRAADGGAVDDQRAVGGAAAHFRSVGIVAWLRVSLLSL